MPDPISLIAVLASILRVVIQEVDNFKKSGDNHQAELVRFRQACESLKDSLSLYQSLYTTYLSGSTQAFSALLRTPLGKQAHHDFLSKLEEANATYQEAANTTTQHQTNKPSLTAAAPLILLKVISGTSDEGTIAAAPLILLDVLGGTPEEVAVASAKVSSSDAGLAHSFKLFHGLYLHHLSSTPTCPQNHAMRRSSSSASDIYKSMDAVISSFYASPFSARATQLSVTEEQLCCLNVDRKALEDFVATMRDAGSGWVEEQMDATQADRGPSMPRVGLMLMELLWSTTLEEHKGLIRNFPPELAQYARETEEPTGLLEGSLVQYITKSKHPTFTIAFCGMVKSGKSLFLNALMGRMVLPSDELPSTAWPCRIRHTPNASQPILTLDDPTPFLEGLRKLRECKYGEKMQHYKPPESSDFCLDLDDFDSDTSTSNVEQEELANIYRCWSDLHKSTHLNLKRFEDDQFTLPKRVEGVEAARKLLGELNDIVRLCLRFRLGFPMDVDDWPLLEVKFSSLGPELGDCTFEFLDLPGLGEHFEEFAFEGLIRSVATEATTVVPIVSFKEITRADWRKLPKIIRNGWDGNLEFVVCTHYDHTTGDNLPAQKEIVKQVFAPKDILPCSSLMGLSASITLQGSQRQGAKPRYSDLFDPTDGIQVHCVEKILGTGVPEKTYASMNRNEWEYAVNGQLAASGLPVVIKALSVDLIVNARQTIFGTQSNELQKLLKRLMRTQSHILLAFRRSESELEDAVKIFEEARGQFDKVLGTWAADEVQRHDNTKRRLEISLARLRARCNVAVKAAFEETVNNSRDNDGFTLNGDSTLVEFKKKADAEIFINDCQGRLVKQLKEFHSEFVTGVRKLAELGRDACVQRLREAIMSPLFQNVPELREDILTELDESSHSLQILAIQHARKILKTERIRYKRDYKTAYQDLATVVSTAAGKVETFVCKPSRKLEQFGFLVKAPMCATVVPAYVMGAAVWPFLTKTKKHILTIAEAEQQYSERIVKPFLDSLEAEAKNSLMNASEGTSATAKEIVLDGLKREKERYQKERVLKSFPLPKVHVAELVWMHGTFAAVRAALEKLSAP